MRETEAELLHMVQMIVLKPELTEDDRKHLQAIQEEIREREYGGFLAPGPVPYALRRLWQTIREKCEGK